MKLLFARAFFLITVIGTLLQPSVNAQQLIARHGTLDESSRNVIILIHGWTNKSLEDLPENYNAFNESPQWTELIHSLQQYITRFELDWEIATYRWEELASTNQIFFDGLSFAYSPAVRAAIAADTLGQHLGANLTLDYPHLRNVHFIAHSAGSWAGKRALEELLKRSPYTVAQLTLLDPFIPDVAPELNDNLITGLSTTAMGQLGNILENTRINRLENYYADDELGMHNPLLSLFPTTSTHEVFLWANSIQSLNTQVDYGAYVPVPFTFGHEHYDYHSGPIEFYNDTVVASIPERSVPEGLLGNLLHLPPFNYLEQAFNKSLVRDTSLSLPKFASAPILDGSLVNGTTATFSVSALRASSYEWYFRAEPDAEPMLKGIGETLTIENLSELDEGEYVVKAIGANGIQYSEALTLSTSELSSPSLFAAGSKVAVSWQDNTSSETGYFVERSTAGGTWVDIATLPANSTAYLDETTGGNQSYSYRISALVNGSRDTLSTPATIQTPESNPSFDVSGDVSVFFSQLFDAEGDPDGYSYGGIGGSISADLDLPITVPIRIASSRLGENGVSWSDVTAWNNPALIINNSTQILPALVGGGFNPSIDVTRNTIDALFFNSGPTERPTPINFDLFTVENPYIPHGEVSIGVGFSLGFDVTLQDDTNVVMNQTAVLQSLSISPTADMIGNPNMRVKGFLDNSGFIDDLSGNIEGVFLNQGTAFVDGNLTLGGQLANIGEIRLQSGTFSVSEDIFNAGELVHEGGSVGGDGTITNLGTYRWTGGSISGTAFENRSAAFSVEGGTAVSLDPSSVFTNTGTVEHSGNTRFFLNGSSSFENRAGATYRLSGGAHFHAQNYSGNAVATFRNLGLLEVSGTEPSHFYRAGSNRALLANEGGTVSLGDGSSLSLHSGFEQTSGLLSINGGSISFVGFDGQIDGGVLQGNGSIVGNFVNEATVKPGFSRGELSFSENYIQGSSGNLEIEILGGSMAQIDRVVVGGSATLAGTVSVQLAPSFSPTVGQTFEFLTFSSRNGEFEDISLSNSASGYAIDVVYEAASAKIIVTAVPESGYDNWLSDHFSAEELLDSTISGRSADPDGDGMTNLEEYAYGSDPRSASGDRAPKSEFTEEDGQLWLELTYYRRISAPDINYTVTTSSDVSMWDDTENNVTEMGEPIPAGDDITEIVRARMSPSASSLSRAFIRLRIQTVEP